MSKQTAFGAIIHGYSRSQAIQDGVLVDVSEEAQEAGFRIPVAMTSAVWADCVAWCPTDSGKQADQDEAGRLWDVLWLARLAARKAQGSHLAFDLCRIPRHGHIPQRVRLHMTIGPGDSGEPVITLLLPGED